MNKGIQRFQLLDSKGYGDFSKTFIEIRDFLMNLEKDTLKKLDYHWGRWAWMFSLPYLDSKFMQKITYYKDLDQIVALMTYESNFGEVYYVIQEGYEYLKEEMIEHAMKTFDEIGTLRILIPDHDEEMKRIASLHQLIPSADAEYTYKMDLDRDLDYVLKDGFKIVSLKDEFDVAKYGKCLYEGFNHELPYLITEEELNNRRISLSAPGIDLSRSIAVKAPDGSFVSYCGTWYRDGDVGVLLEPVATVPEYRKQGFGKAAIYEALRRARDHGAKVATVGSRQVFYQKLGFSYYWESHFWVKK